MTEEKIARINALAQKSKTTVYPARASARPAAACRASVPTIANRFVSMPFPPFFRCALSYAGRWKKQRIQDLLHMVHGRQPAFL